MCSAMVSASERQRESPFRQHDVPCFSEKICWDQSVFIGPKVRPDATMCAGPVLQCRKGILASRREQAKFNLSL